LIENGERLAASSTARRIRISGFHPVFAILATSSGESTTVRSMPISFAK